MIRVDLCHSTRPEDAPIYIRLQLPAVPIPGDSIEFNGGMFRVLRRSWVVDEDSVVASVGIDPPIPSYYAILVIE